MAETLTPPGYVNPGQGTEQSFEPRVLIAQFGDGYTQRSGDGINAENAKVTVQFSALTAAEKNWLQAFFSRHQGYIHFLWKFPGETETKKWIARRWRTTPVDYNAYSVNAEFERVFDQ